MQACDGQRILERIQKRGLTYEAFRSILADAARDPQHPYHHYHVLNLRRSERLEKTFRVPPEIESFLRSCDKPTTWMVITEPWCGDSAQSLPCIARIAETSSNVTLRILLRDENPDVIDCFLTEGKRAIPKLVVFDHHGKELFRWGPRPAEAQQLFAAALHATGSKEEALRAVHAWYGRDRCRSLVSELSAELRKACDKP